jgi:hypothetical protein
MSGHGHAAAAIAGALLMMGCEDLKQQKQPDPRATENPDKYARDRDYCRAQVDEYLRQRRNIEDAGRGVGDQPETVGQRGLSNEMAAYGDNRNADRAMADCMEQRGWPQPRPPWWQRIGGS